VPGSFNRGSFGGVPNTKGLPVVRAFDTTQFAQPDALASGADEEGWWGGFQTAIVGMVAASVVATTMAVAAVAQSNASIEELGTPTTVAAADPGWTPIVASGRPIVVAPWKFGEESLPVQGAAPTIVDEDGPPLGLPAPARVVALSALPAWWSTEESLPTPAAAATDPGWWTPVIAADQLVLAIPWRYSEESLPPISVTIVEESGPPLALGFAVVRPVPTGLVWGMDEPLPIAAGVTIVQEERWVSGYVVSDGVPLAVIVSRTFGTDELLPVSVGPVVTTLRENHFTIALGVRF